MEKYYFRRTDNGKVVEVDFETMMRDQINGYIELDDGNGGKVAARRVHGNVKPDPKNKVVELPKPIVSDSLGFMTEQFAEFEADRKAHGFHDIEFKPDPQSPGVMQAHIGSQRSLQRYLKHLGMIDKNSRNGSRATLSPRDFEAAQKRMREMFPVSAGEEKKLIVSEKS